MDTNNKYFIENGYLNCLPVPEQRETKMQVYEVLRVIDGVPLFAEDHLERLQSSCSLSGIESPLSAVQFSEQINVLIEANRIVTANLKIELAVLHSGQLSWQMYPIAHQYPSGEDYLNGVRCGLLHLERVNPQAKVVQQIVREQANAAIATNNWYEAILVNAENSVTEGSRSNVFFIQAETVYTAPADQVLLGITRAKVLDCLRDMGVQLVQQPIDAERLPDFDAAFISGTSPKILPIAQIDGAAYSVENPLLQRLMFAYEQLISSYISANRQGAGTL